MDVRVRRLALLNRLKLELKEEHILEGCLNHCSVEVLKRDHRKNFSSQRVLFDVLMEDLVVDSAEYVLDVLDGLL